MPDDRGILAPCHPLWTERYSKTQVYVLSLFRYGIVHANVAGALLSYSQIVVGEVKEAHANRPFGNLARRSAIQKVRQIDKHRSLFGTQYLA
jgi:hypothetical protein